MSNTTTTTTNPDPTPASTPTPTPNSKNRTSSNPAPNEEEDPTPPIDALLTHYLTLLDEYTALRQTLHTLQARLFHDLARANFAAERGVRRYGRDYYDGRMQAGRRVLIDEGGVSVSVEEEGVEGQGVEGVGGVDGGDVKGGEGEGEGVVFRVAVYPPAERGDGGKEAGDGMGKEESSAAVGDGEENEDVKEKQPGKDGSAAAPGSGEDKKETVKPVDPLRWFGILTPLPLRQAQGHAITAVEEIIPRLATLSTAMAAVELEVRRARKKRAKAKKAGEKKLVALEEKMAEVDVNA